MQCAVCGSGWKVWKGPAVEVAFACSETSGSGSGVYLKVMYSGSGLDDD